MNNYYEKKLEHISSDEAQVLALESMNSTVVIAGPGSGKTTVLTLKVIKLLTETIHEPRGLACLTYSIEAASELKDRLVKMGLGKRRNVFLGTVHGFCLSEVLLPFGELYPKYKIPFPIRIVSEKEKRKLFDKQNYSGNPRIEEVDKERTRCIQGISNVELDSYQVALKAAIDFEKVLIDNGYIDFISMVKFAVELIKNEPYIRKALESKFPWIIIDEYQDLGKPLHELVLSLLELTDIKVFAVGDADQSIYDFQGAAPDYLIELSQKQGISVIHLINNYRSSQEIVRASEYILNNDRGYIACGEFKDYHDEIEFLECANGMSGEYEISVEQIKKAHASGVPYHEIAVLVASNRQVADLAEECKKAEIPFHVSRQEFRKTALIKWLCDCAKWLVDKYNNSFDSICSTWISFLSQKGILSTDDRMRVKARLYSVISESQQYKECLIKWLYFLDEKLGIVSLFKELERYPDELENWYVFLEKVESQVPALTIDYLTCLGYPNNQVVLSTRHSSKGLEFDVIIMLGMEKDSFPNYHADTQSKMDEARRLCFVAVSRARLKCILVRSTRLQYKNGKWIDKQPSPFWTELKEFQDMNKENSK